MLVAAAMRLRGSDWRLGTVPDVRLLESRFRGDDATGAEGAPLRKRDCGVRPRAHGGTGLRPEMGNRPQEASSVADIVRAPICLAVVVLLAACNDSTVVEPAGEEALSPTLPRLAVLGDLPSSSTPRVIEAAADGRLTWNGRRCTEPELVAILQADVRRTGHPIEGARPDARVSDESVLLSVDGRLPWGATLRLWEDCIESGFSRLWFAAADERDGSRGALGVPPSKVPEGSFPLQSLAERKAVRLLVRVDPSGKGGSPERLYSAIRGRAPSPGVLFAAWIDVPASVSTELVLRCIDAAVRAGSTHVMYCTRSEQAVIVRGRPFDELARMPTSSSYSITIDDVSIDDVPLLDMPRPPRGHGGVEIRSPWYWP